MATYRRYCHEQESENCKLPEKKIGKKNIVKNIVMVIVILTKKKKKPKQTWETNLKNFVFCY